MIEYTGDPEHEENSLDDWGEIYAISRGVGCPNCGATGYDIDRTPSRHEDYEDCSCWVCGTNWTERVEDDEDAE